MVIITLAGWFTLYQPVRRVVAYEYRKHAASLTFVVALCIELFITRDFVRTIAAKVF